MDDDDFDLNSQAPETETFPGLDLYGGILLDDSEGLFGRRGSGSALPPYRPPRAGGGEVRAAAAAPHVQQLLFGGSTSAAASRGRGSASGAGVHGPTTGVRDQSEKKTAERRDFVDFHRKTLPLSPPPAMAMEHLRWRLTVNERDFIERALQSDLRVDGRHSFDFRKLKITFGREDGSSEVQLGETHVMGYVTAQLVQPYRDRPNEGTLAIFTEFSPMADPAFEPGRPGESAIELGRVIDRGLRESRAVDMESLCVVAGKHVWSVRVDLHILDNGGNLIDAANIAALAALSTFRRPECTVGGDDGQQVTVHDPEVRDPCPLTIHHMPIAVTFAYFGEGNIVVLDPTYKEEAVMGGRMTATVNSNGDVCAIQKAGGEGVMSSVIMQCLRIASIKAADITSKIKKAVDSYTTEKALKKVKRLPTLVPQKVNVTDVTMEDKGDGELEKQTVQMSSDVQQISKDPPTVVKASSHEDAQPMIESSNAEVNTSSAVAVESDESQEIRSPKSLKDAIKPKHKRKKKKSEKS